MGTSSGPKAQEVTSALEKLLRKTVAPSVSSSKGLYLGETVQETLELAVATLATALGQELKTSDVEIGLVTLENPRFQVLGTEQIEGILTGLAERD